jgi:uncharacterized phiE125 gp8 family phage protein
MSYGLKTVTAATDTCVTLAEAKLHLKVENTTDDSLITILIKAAQDAVESFTNRVLMSTTFELQLDEFCMEIKLPVAPVSSVSSVKYYDETNSEQTMAAGNYFYSVDQEPMEIEFITSQSVYTYRQNALNIQFVAGYANAAAVPNALKQAVLLLVGDMYENRLDLPRERFTMWKQLVYPYKVFYAS